MKHPCPICGEEKTKYERELERKTKQNELIEVFKAGRRSVKKFSTRENEVFDSFYELGMTDFRDIARNYGIEKHTVETYYDRMMDKLCCLMGGGDADML